MSPNRPLSFWVAILAVALLGLLGPLAHICPADPRWLASSSDDRDLEDGGDQLLADAGMFDTVPTLSAPRGGHARLLEDGPPAAPAGPRYASPPRAPPALLAASLRSGSRSEL